jgi:hypothetical protein
MRNQTIKMSAITEIVSTAAYAVLTWRLFSTDCTFTATFCQADYTLAAPLRLTGFREILSIVRLGVEGSEFKEGQTCGSCHPVAFLDGNVSRGLMPTVQLTCKLVRQRVVIMMEKFCRLLCGYFLDRHQPDPFGLPAVRCRYAEFH